MTYLAAFLALFLLLWAAFYKILPGIWRGMQWLAGHSAALTQRSSRGQRAYSYASRFRDYWPVLLIVAGGALATMWLGDFFVDLAELVQGKSTLLAKVDSGVLGWVVGERSASATRFFVAMTMIGGPAGVAVIVILAAIALAVRRKWAWLSYLAVTAGGGGLLNLELKNHFARARPALAEAIRRAGGYSFPSGHAMGSTVAFGALAYLAIRLSWQWRWKAASLALACTMVLAVAASRVYLGVHWLSDVGAGISAGTVWVLVTTVAYETFRRIRGVRRLRLAARNGAVEIAE